MSEGVEETKLAMECDKEEAVDCSCDGILLTMLAPPSVRACVFDLGLASVLSRRKMPETAYETGYVK